MVQSSEAQAQVAKVASTRFEVNFSQLNKLWFQAINFLNSGDMLEANLKLKDLHLKKLEVGLENLPSHSAILIKKAYELNKGQRTREAIELTEIAGLLSPDVPAVHFALAKLHFAEDLTGIYRVLRDVWRGLALKFTDITTIVTYINHGFFALVLTGMFTSAIFIIFSFVYYRRAIFYQIREMVPGQPPTMIAHIIGWVLLALVTLGLGMYWGGLLLALSLLLSAQLEPTAKVLLQCMLFFGGILVVLLVAVGVTFSTYDGEYFHALRDISRGEFSSRSSIALQKRLEVYSNDAYALFGLAYIAQKTGKDKEAAEAYEMISSQFPDQAAVQNNLGNLYQHWYRTTKKETWYEKAKEVYNSAIRRKPKMFEAHYNLGQLLLLKTRDGEEGGESLKKARDIDTRRFTFYSESLGEGKKSIDTSFSTMTLIKRLYEKDFLYNGTVIVKRLWASGSRFHNPLHFSIACGALFFLSLMSGSKKKTSKKRIIYCQMCGDPYTLTRRKSKEQHATFCTQCTHIFKKKSVIKPENRAAKVKQIQLRQKVRGLFAKVSSLIFPGAGQIYFGYPVKGVLLSFCFSLAATIFLLKGYWRILLDAGGGSLFSWTTVGLLILLSGGAYLLNLRDVLKLSPKNQ